MPIAGEIGRELDARLKAIREAVQTPEQARMTAYTLNVNTSRGGFNIECAQLPMDRYYRRKYISFEQYRAGERLYADFYVSGQIPITTVNFNAIPSSDRRSYLPATDRQRDALTNWRDALASIQGKIGQLMALNVCCYGGELKDINYLGKNLRMARFKDALDDLLIFYKG